MKICIILGTRPEIIKLSSIIRICEKKGLNYFVIHTGQHYNFNLDRIFFEELKLPKPKYNLTIKESTPGKQTAKIIEKIEDILLDEYPTHVFVQGDTNTVLAGGIACSKLSITLCHIEAGLRSYNQKMPEEINRILIDHISDLLFTPTDISKNCLIMENINRNKIYVTGNTIVDATLENLTLANQESQILEKLKLKKGKFFLLTLHRAENVDNKSRIEEIMNFFDLFVDMYDEDIIFPIHPRTEKMIKQFGYYNRLKNNKRIKLIEPVGYLDFLKLEASSKIILTDSGGIQEEATILKIPCITLRNETERPETSKIGANILSGTDPKKIMECIFYMYNKTINVKNPFGDGNSSKKIIDIIINNSK